MRCQLLAILAVIVLATTAYAQSATTFTYQGQLIESGTPADGLYEFEVRLLDVDSFQIGLTETPIATVTEGVFTMDLDFGPAAFDASQRYLEISVRSLMAGGAYTTLSPNHPITSTPIAQFALAGNEGPIGPQGTPGNDGNDGAPGADGSDGAVGPEGPVGPPGTTDWNGLINIPADIADGDANTTYTAGSGLQLAGTQLSIPSAAITSTHLGSNSVGASEITANAVGSSEIASGAVGSSEIAANSILSSDIATNAVGSSEIAANAVGSSEIATAAVGSAEIANFAVGSSKIATNAVGSLQIAPNAVCFSEMANNSVGAAELQSVSSSLAKVSGGLAVATADRFGIGVASPTDRFHVNALAGQTAFRVQTNGITRIRVNANGGVSLGGNSTIIGTGDVYIPNRLGIGTSAPTFDLSVSGTAAKTGGGSWAVFSDARLKQNIKPMTGSLNLIAALRPVSFEYKSKDHFSFAPGTQRGFIAQEVAKVIPQWVHTADDGYLYLDQTGYEALIVDALQELRAEKDNEIQQLRTEKDKEVQQLQLRLERLERAMILLSNSN